MGIELTPSRQVRDRIQMLFARKIRGYQISEDAVRKKGAETFETDRELACEISEFANEIARLKNELRSTMLNKYPWLK